MTIETPTKPFAYSAEARSESFGYTCNRCLRCCHNKHIQLNPYEVARLAHNVGETTTEFKQRHTLDGEGTVLLQQANGACVFLGEQGCTVHPDRPLVCRLYPIGRHVSPEGTETFSHLEPHPQTAGVYSKNGTIADFLALQDAKLFMDAADDYYQWLLAAMDAGETDAEDDEGNGNSAADILDMDAAVNQWAAAVSKQPPTDIEERKISTPSHTLRRNQSGAKPMSTQPDNSTTSPTQPLSPTRRRAVATAVSLLAASLGVGVTAAEASPTDTPNTISSSNQLKGANQHKITSIQQKGANQFKIDSIQQKDGSNQAKWDTNQLKGETVQQPDGSNQAKWDTNQLKGETVQQPDGSNQAKRDTNQLKSGSVQQKGGSSQLKIKSTNQAKWDTNQHK